MEIAAKLVFCIVLLMSLAVLADEVPTQVTYIYASNDLNEKIKEKLIELIRTRSSLSGLVTSIDNRDAPVIIGKNLGDRILKDLLAEDVRKFTPVDTEVPMKMVAPIQFVSHGITQLSQLETTSINFWKHIEIDSDYVIRKLTGEEMALVWFFIGWDLDEPIFVVEDSNNSIVFDFDATGEHLDWIEDIKNMEYAITLGEKTIMANPRVLGEGKEKHVMFFGSDDERFYVIE